MTQPEYLPIQECFKLTTVQDIEKQVDCRRALIREYVGTLYPSILFSEIDQLSTLRARIKYHE